MELDEKAFEKQLNLFVSEVSKRLHADSEMMGALEEKLTLQNEVILQFSKKLSEFSGFVSQVSDALKVLEAGQERRSAPEKMAEEAVSGVIRKVLIVESKEINRVMISHYLKTLSLQLDFVMTDAEFLERIQQEIKYDLIVVNLTQNQNNAKAIGINGSEVLKNFRQLDTKIPILGVTRSLPTQAELAKSQEVGCTNCISHENEKEEWVAQVTRLLRQA